MKPVMNMEGEKVPHAVAVEVPVAQAPKVDKNKFRKYVAVSVTAVLVTAIVTAGVVTCALLFTNTQNELIKRTVTFKDLSGHYQSEDIEADVLHNTVTFIVHGPQGKLTAFNDYNMKLGVVAVHEGAEDQHCLVYVLNTTLSAKDDVDQENSGEIEKIEYLHRDVVPIVTPTFLPSGSPDLCSNVLVYWATITTMAPKRDGWRQKRSAPTRSKPRVSFYRKGSIVVVQDTIDGLVFFLFPITTNNNNK